MKFDQSRPYYLPGLEVPLRLRHSRRKTVAIVVSAEHGVEVRAPLRMPAAEAMAFAASKQHWIEKQLRAIAARPARHETRFHWGESLYFLGDRLYFHCQPGTEVDLQLAGRVDDPPAAIQRRVEQWFQRQAAALFEERYQYWRQQMAGWSLPPSSLHLRRMKRRWGTCRSNGKILINTHLAKYPMACVDAVLVHELCHLLEFNHSPRFYALLDAVLPQWRLADEQLNRLSLLY
ncbi:MAG: SprT family zinc-dependent metalloprotease [Pseudomonadota bacterium]|nr:hypothetical protein [Pseudomonadales bacterium]MDY6921777.1 SprT family zinc-dependent metalloprotease [Pseudomonadota bacterium]